MDKPVLESIHIQNFRCFEHLDINRLARINLIAGRNSVGKTAVLEAIFLLLGAENIGRVAKIGRFRGLGGRNGPVGDVLDLLWSPLFYQLRTAGRIEVAADLSTGGERKVELTVATAPSRPLAVGSDGELLKPGATAGQVLRQRFTDSNHDESTFEVRLIGGELHIQPVPSTQPFPGHFISARRPPSPEELAALFGQLVRSKRVRDLDLVKILNIVEPRLTQLDVIPSGGASMVYGDIGLKQMLPLSLLGDGIERVIGVVLRIANAPGGIVLIDEVENGLHHSILSDFWQVIDRAAQTFNTQVIATTHSYECIREAHQAFSQNGDYDFLLHRLDRVGDQVETVTYDQEALGAALKAEFEVR